MRYICRECETPTDKIFSLVSTRWCPISLEILERTIRLICEPCYRQTMKSYAEEQMKKVREKPDGRVGQRQSQQA